MTTPTAPSDPDPAAPSRRRPITPEGWRRLVAAGGDREVRLYQDADTGAFFTISAPVPAAHVDRVLEATCPHDPATWHRAPDATGRDLVTCYACGVSWYAAE